MILVLNAFKSRISNGEKFALKNRVLLIKTSKVSVDISLVALPFEKKMIKKAAPFNYSRNCSLITCSAEDLIVLKAFADRLQDWLDIEGIVMRQQKKINTK